MALPELPIPAGQDSHKLAYGTGMQQVVKIKRTNLGEGHSQRAEESVKQEWNLVWKGLDNDLAEDLRVFFAGLGGAAAFQWTPFGQTTPLKFITAEESFSSEPSGFGVSDCSQKVEEVFDFDE